MKDSRLQTPDSRLHPPTPPSFPLRPVNGGPLDLAQPKFGEWSYEPKYNGWRALVHVPTGRMFNRKLERLSIEQEFAPALEKLRQPSDGTNTEFEWLDCEALERRHGIGRGALVILDWVIAGRTYVQRREELEKAFYIPHSTCLSLSADSVSLPRSTPQAQTLWDLLREANHIMNAPFYEGLVAKRSDSLYPFQLRSPSVEFPFWMKHRWAF